MIVGSCCYLTNEGKQNIDAKSIKIYGIQRSLLVNFEVEQIFSHSEKEAKEITYLFPNDNKICIYDITFIVGEEIIKPKLQPKKEAEKTYQEAISSGHTAIYGNGVSYGMTLFKIGNIQPNVECKIILKLAFTGQITNQKSFFIKFPFDYNYQIDPFKDKSKYDFYFQLQIDSEFISKFEINIDDVKYYEKSELISVSCTLKEISNNIFITFDTHKEIKSSCLISQTDSVNYESCMITISPNLPPKENSIKEFIFVVDCSGSMSGKSIKKAAECLEFFIKSLPPNSYFNIIRFGSQYVKLFEKSVLYNDETSEEAINLALNLKADFGGTEIYSPLNDIFSSKSCINEQRQIFIMTDGEDSNEEEVLELVSANAKENRCFTIGIGRGCDVGLIEEIAKKSGGKSDFVHEGDSISDKLIPQLKSSLQPTISSIEIHFEGEDNDSFEVSPYPIPFINWNGSYVVYARKRKNNKNGILITGVYGDESIDILVEEIHQLSNVEEDKFGFAYGKNISNAILPLFAFSFLKNIELKYNKEEIPDQLKAKAIELSIASGVLCKYTGYFGMTELPNKSLAYLDDPFAVAMPHNKAAYNDPFSSSSRKQSDPYDPFAAAISQNQAASNDPFSSSQNKTASNDPFSSLQNKAASNDPFSSSQIQKCADDPFSSSQIQKCADDPFSSSQIQKCTDDPFSSLQNKAASNDPFSSSQIQKCADDPFSSLQNKTASNDPFSSSQIQKCTDDPFSSSSQIQKCADDPFSSSQKQKCTDDPFSSSSQKQKCADDPFSSLQNKTASNDPFSSSQIQKCADDPFSSSQKQKCTDNPFSSSSQIQKCTDNPFSSSSQIQKCTDDPFSSSQIQKCTDDPFSSSSQKQGPIKEFEIPNKCELITLVRNQKANGYWDDLNAVKNITGINIDCIDEIQLPDKNIEKKCIATIFAIAAMRVKYSKEKNSWIMIEQKAISWLKKTLPDVDIEKVISKIDLCLGDANIDTIK